MDIFIGIACGFFVGTMFLNIAALMVFRPNKWPSILAGLLTKASYPLPLAILLPIVIVLTWGIIGGVMALLYLALDQAFPKSGFGSPNWLFTIFVCLIILNFIILGTLYIGRKIWLEGYLLGVIVIGMFGWLMPWLLS